MIFFDQHKPNWLIIEMLYAIVLLKSTPFFLSFTKSTAKEAG